MVWLINWSVVYDKKRQILSKLRFLSLYLRQVFTSILTCIMPMNEWPKAEQEWSDINSDIGTRSYLAGESSAILREGNLAVTISHTPPCDKAANTEKQCEGPCSFGSSTCFPYTMSQCFEVVRNRFGVSTNYSADLSPKARHQRNNLLQLEGNSFEGFTKSRPGL